MSNITLTEDQIKKILQDMDSKVEMLTPEEVAKIATELNKKVDIPFIKEDTEHTMICKIVKKIDRILYKSLPNEIYGLVKHSNDGITKEDADRLERVLATRLNKSLDLPYLPEWVEQQIFETVIGLLVHAMLQGKSIDLLADEPG